MFWTNWVKKMSKAFIALSIIGCLIAGYSLGRENPIIGLFVAFVGYYISISFVSLIMMICEISDNIARMTKKAVNTECGNTSNSWKCPKCGKVNPNSSRVCMDCSYNK